MSERAVPILPSSNLGHTLEFYESLGFENRGADPEVWKYLIVGRGAIELHFVEDTELDPLSTAGMCYLFVDDADAIFRAWSEVVVEDPATGSRLGEPVDTDYGMREFALVDRNGNLIRVGAMPG